MLVFTDRRLSTGTSRSAPQRQEPFFIFLFPRPVRHRETLRLLGKLLPDTSLTIASPALFQADTVPDGQPATLPAKRENLHFPFLLLRAHLTSRPSSPWLLLIKRRRISLAGLSIKNKIQAEEKNDPVRLAGGGTRPAPTTIDRSENVFFKES